MICEKCGKNKATTHIHTVINGVVTDINLCYDCAEKSGYADNGFMGLFSSVMNTDAFSDGSQNRCEFCNTSFSEIARTGKMGCPECYKKFSKQLIPYLKRLHGAVKHTGKRNEPEKLVVVNGEDDKLKQMRAKLSELVSKEEFEEAAVLRDEIKEIERKKENE